MQLILAVVSGLPPETLLRNLLFFSVLPIPNHYDGRRPSLTSWALFPSGGLDAFAFSPEH
jgi:hypothetical protein